MSIQIIQKPADVQSAQSPIVFSITTSGSQAYTASEFQYTANLYAWDDSPASSGSYIYQARKYPNISGSGIFDFSKMINSAISTLGIEETGGNGVYYKAEFGYQYESGSTYVTQSGGLLSVTCSAGGTFPFYAVDGYSLFPSPINQSIASGSTRFPFMTDTYLVTQSFVVTDTDSVGGNGNFVGLPLYIGENDYFTANNVDFLKVEVSGSYIDGTRFAASSSLFSVNFSQYSYQVIEQLPLNPREYPGLVPITIDSNVDKYWIKVVSGSTQYGPTIQCQVVCPHYYEPVRIVYKNRYGSFDWLNFYKRHNETFNTEQRLYQPQLGTWQSAALSYNQYQTSQQRYIVDATQTLECNTDWLEEGYNELFKQLMVSDEIYWVYYQDQSGFNDLVKPLTIQTNSLQFKTGVNNKLIQYTITFDIGQPYKLLL